METTTKGPAQTVTKKAATSTRSLFEIKKWSENEIWPRARTKNVAGFGEWTCTLEEGWDDEL